MNNMESLKKYHIAAAFFTLIFGSLSHFFYSWSDESPLAAPFFPVNESTWEHLKLLVTPLLLFSVIEYFVYGKKRKDFIPVRTISLLSGILLIICLFYGYTAVVGSHWLWADISIFVVSVMGAYFLSFYLFRKSFFSCNRIGLITQILLAVLLVLFILFTQKPPHVFLFQDPVTGGYGI